MNTSPNDPEDKLIQALKTNGNHELSPELANRLRTQLAPFREKLKEHPYVRSLARRRWRGWRILRRTLCYGMASLLLLVFMASLTQAGRQFLSERTLKVFLLLDEMGQIAMRGDWKTYNARMDQADAVPPATLQDAAMERFLGLSPDHSSILILAVGGGLSDWGARVSSASIWSVDIKTGLVTPIHQGKVLDSCISLSRGQGKELQSILYMARPKNMRMKPGTRQFVSPDDQLWFYDFKNPPTIVDQGWIAGRWQGVSPNNLSMFYVKTNFWGAYSVIHDLDRHSTRNLKGNLGLAVGWTTDSQTIITMNGEGGPALTAFKKISTSSGKVLESLDVAALYAKRGMLGDPLFNGGNYFSVTTRDHKYFTENHEDRIDIFSIQPFRHVVSTTGTGLLWSPDRNHAIIHKTGRTLRPLIEKQVAGKDGRTTRTVLGDFSPKQGRDTGIRSAERSTMIGIFDAATGQMTDLDLARLHPPFKSIGPGASTFLVDEGSMISPISLMTVNANPRFGVLDLVSRRVVYSDENFSPNTAVWSPDGRMLAVRSRRGAQSDFQAYVIDMIAGQIKDLGFKDMRPLAWLDNQTVVWMNRWSGQDPKIVGPFKLMVTDMKTDEIKTIPMRDK